MIPTPLSRPAVPGWRSAITEVCTWLYGPVHTVQPTGLQTFTCVMADGDEVHVRVDDAAPGHTMIALYCPEDEQAAAPSPL